MSARTKVPDEFQGMFVLVFPQVVWILEMCPLFLQGVTTLAYRHCLHIDSSSSQYLF